MSDSIEKQNLKRAIKEAFNTQAPQNTNLSPEEITRQALESISNKITEAVDAYTQEKLRKLKEVLTGNDSFRGTDQAGLPVTINANSTLINYNPNN